MILVLLANGFEEIEALTSVDILRRAGKDVKTVGIGSLEIAGAHGITVKADVSEAEALALTDRLEMLLLPGGMPGTKNLDASATTDKLLEKAQADGGYIAAICAAPSVLGKRGLLRGKKAICYPGFENELLGATVCDCGYVTDGKIITGRAMGSALDFALELCKALCGVEKAESVRTSVIA